MVWCILTLYLGAFLTRRLRRAADADSDAQLLDFRFSVAHSTLSFSIMWNNSPGNWPRSSQLEFLITRATTAAQPENNYALHIEIAEYINQKKSNRYILYHEFICWLAQLASATSPREAAMLVVQAVNHRNPHVSLLALGLLDTLVQMCGYPFHLQIATKEFLNELVRRFPERPPPFPNAVMTRILELIHVWKEGICVESRWRDDLGNIRDMHRLLSFKGYRFRDIHRTPSAPPTSVCLPPPPQS
jgi:ADP-ribosylation factor-binding protein GGA